MDEGKWGADKGRKETRPSEAVEMYLSSVLEGVLVQFGRLMTRKMRQGEAHCLCL
jgi:hypothetical protein